jgi:hypothetical protein
MKILIIVKGLRNVDSKRFDLKSVQKVVPDKLNDDIIPDKFYCSTSIPNLIEICYVF